MRRGVVGNERHVTVDVRKVARSLDAARIILP
jgi:hypothetical protein